MTVTHMQIGSLSFTPVFSAVTQLIGGEKTIILPVYVLKFPILIPEYNCLHFALRPKLRTLPPKKRVRNHVINNGNDTMSKTAVHFCGLPFLFAETRSSRPRRGGDSRDFRAFRSASAAHLQKLHNSFAKISTCFQKTMVYWHQKKEGDGFL